MKILLYAGWIDETKEKIRKAVERQFPQKELYICLTVDEISARLKTPMVNVSVAILLAADKKDLSDLFSIRDLLVDMRIILILPDNDEDTMAKAYSLYPRFIHYTDSDFKDVLAVLERMHEHTIYNMELT